MDLNYVSSMIDMDSESVFLVSNNDHNNDRSNKRLPSFINTFPKFAWNVSNILTSDKQINENTIDVEPGPSNQKSASYTKKKIVIPKKNTVNVNEFNICSEEIDEKRSTARTSSMNNKEELRNNKQTNENTENESSNLFGQTSVSCMKKRAHKKVYLFKCEYESCDKKFRTKQYLKYHITSHTGEKNIKCDHCSKKFSKRSNMLKHVRDMHVDKKKYKCKHCSKRFLHKRNVLRHVARAHSSEKKYECTHCEKCFSTSEDLKQHKKVHSTEKSYSCKCGGSFKYRSTLQRHKRTKKCKFSEEFSRVKPVLK